MPAARGVVNGWPSHYGFEESLIEDHKIQRGINRTG